MVMMAQLDLQVALDPRDLQVRQVHQATLVPLVRPEQLATLDPLDPAAQQVLKDRQALQVPRDLQVAMDQVALLALRETQAKQALLVTLETQAIQVQVAIQGSQVLLVTQATRAPLGSLALLVNLVQLD